MTRIRYDLPPIETERKRKMPECLNYEVRQINLSPDDSPNERDTRSFKIKCQAKFYAWCYIAGNRAKARDDFGQRLSIPTGIDPFRSFGGIPQPLLERAGVEQIAEKLRTMLFEDALRAERGIDGDFFRCRRKACRNLKRKFGLEVTPERMRIARSTRNHLASGKKPAGPLAASQTSLTFRSFRMRRYPYRQVP
jgi:hypothetical protein